MKALTICQPYAALIMQGDKRVENRTWYTRYRGPLAIHAGKSKTWLDGFPPEDYVFGAVLGTANLIDCVKFDLLEPGSALDRKYPWLRLHDHSFGPFCWVLADVVAYPEPIRCNGAQGLWDFEPITIPAVQS